MERTEEQKLCHDPITVILGGKSYDLPPLTIKESRVWRAKLVEVLRTLPQKLKETDSVDFNLGMIFLTTPDMATDLFFAYAKSLDREKIEAEAYEDELALAFEKVLEYARPLGLTKSLTAAIPKLLQ